MTGGSKQDPEEVAEAALRASSDSSDLVIHGLKNKVQAGMTRFLSDEARAKMQGAQAKKP